MNAVPILTVDLVCVVKALPLAGHPFVVPVSMNTVTIVMKMAGAPFAKMVMSGMMAKPRVQQLVSWR